MFLFYPKYHCELNFIEQYWGAAKLRYRNSQWTSSITAMEKNVIKCLDDVGQLEILRYELAFLVFLLNLTLPKIFQLFCTLY